MSSVLFFIAAIGVISGAVGVVLLRNPFYSVLALVGHLLDEVGVALVCLGCELGERRRRILGIDQHLHVACGIGHVVDPAQ